MNPNVLLRPFSEIRAAIGQDLGCSDWVVVDQQRIDLFAEATDDFNDIHVDPQVGRTSPFGTTIAQGMLTFSMLTKLASKVVPVPQVMSVGYYHGFD